MHMNTTSSTQRLPWILCGMLCMALLGSLLPPVIAQDDDQEPDDPRYLPTPSGGNADSNQDMIAVTGVDITGTSVLYLVDTRSKQLVVYQASGGGSTTQSVRLVGARNISLDLRLDDPERVVVGVRLGLRGFEVHLLDVRTLHLEVCSASRRRRRSSWCELPTCGCVSSFKSRDLQYSRLCIATICNLSDSALGQGCFMVACSGLGVWGQWGERINQ